MAQNRSHAVMSQRSEPGDSLDDFPTPPWGTRALLEMLQKRHLIRPGSSVREPAANRGYMVRPLSEAFMWVQASDVHDYGAGFQVDDFLFPSPLRSQTSWVVTNPPFRLGKAFAHQAIKHAAHGVALLTRTQFLEGANRYGTLYLPFPPSHVFQFVERLPMVKGRCDPKASTATSYCWIVWNVEEGPGGPTVFDWIAPCRARLEKPGDYD